MQGEAISSWDALSRENWSSVRVCIKEEYFIACLVENEATNE